MSPSTSPAARRPLLRPAALGVVLGLVLAGCSSGSSSAGPSVVASPVGGAAASSSAVAELQAGLTAQLVERVYAIGAVGRAVAAAAGELDDPGAQAATAALDAGSAGLADVLGATYSDAREPLLAALRREDRLLVRQAAAAARGDRDAAAGAQDLLVEVRLELAEEVRRAVPVLDAEDVAGQLPGDPTATSAAQLQEAAGQARGAARLLADGIATHRGLGQPATEAARLRADLTGLLVEHVHLLGVQARGEPAGEPLDRNARELAAVLGETYPSLTGPFLRSWTAHLDRLEGYTTGATADGMVRGYPEELSRLLAEHVRGLPAATAHTELDRALDAQLAAIDAAVAGSSSAPAALRDASAAVLPTAALLSAAVAEDLRLS